MSNCRKEPLVEIDQEGVPQKSYCCYWPSHEGSERCIWHSGEADSRPEVIEKLLKQLQEDPEQVILLDRAKLSGLSLSTGTSFAGASLLGSQLKACRGAEINFSDTVLHDANFTEAALRDGTFHSAVGTTIDFREADLSGTCLDEAQMRKCRFEGSDLSGVHAHNFNGNSSSFADSFVVDSKFTNAEFRDCDFARAKLNGAEITESILEDSELERIECNDASFNDSKIADVRAHEIMGRAVKFRNTTLESVHITDGELRRSEFIDSEGSDVSLAECDLRGTDLSRAKISSINLSQSKLNGSNLSNATFSDATLTGAHLKEADLSNVKLKQATLSDVILTGADLREAQFQEANLVGAELKHVDLHYTSFRNSELQRSEISGGSDENESSHAIFIGAYLEGAKIFEIDFEDAKFSDGNLSECCISASTFNSCEFSEAELSDCVLEECEFVDCDFKQANLANIDTEDVRLEDVSLEGASLCGADLSGAELSGVSFHGASLEEVDLSGAELTNCDFSRATLDSCVLEGARADKDTSFTGASLVGATCRKAKFRGVDLTEASLLDCNFRMGDLREATLEATLLERANLFATDLRDSFLYGAGLTGARINAETKLSVETPYERGESPVGGEEVSKPENLRKASSTHRALERLAIENSLPEAVSRHHIRSEETTRRAVAVQFWRTVGARYQRFRWRYRDPRDISGKAPEGLPDISGSVIKSGWSWFKRTLSRGVIQYGEGYRNLSLLTVFTLLLSTVFYINGYAVAPDGRELSVDLLRDSRAEVIRALLDGFLFSLASFVSPGFTDFAPAGIGGRLVTTAEAAIGTAVFALFIYVIGRQAGR
ncbi:pentapeptide repeat-containing protein [Haloarchaeobius sp. DYHT-AS-18]|uniref:pentapeptide repeat-containing protein n=1 Tax=Haloarchaeobius sp. DYHT-AS-18 TaxID=3446117 RepID=UPI003EBBECF9